jgi:hypothetical protein
MKIKKVLITVVIIIIALIVIIGLSGVNFLLPY